MGVQTRGGYTADVTLENRNMNMPCCVEIKKDYSNVRPACKFRYTSFELTANASKTTTECTNYTC